MRKTSVTIAVLSAAALAGCVLDDFPTVHHCVTSSDCELGSVCNMASERCVVEVSAGPNRFAGTFTFVLAPQYNSATGKYEPSAGASNVWARANFNGSDYLTGTGAFFKLLPDGSGILFSTYNAEINRDMVMFSFFIATTTLTAGKDMDIGSEVFGSLDYYTYLGEDHDPQWTMPPRTIAEMTSGRLTFEELSTNPGDTWSGQFSGTLGAPTP